MGVLLVVFLILGIWALLRHLGQTKVRAKNVLLVPLAVGGGLFLLLFLWLATNGGF